MRSPPSRLLELLSRWWSGCRLIYLSANSADVLWRPALSAVKRSRQHIQHDRCIIQKCSVVHHRWARMCRQLPLAVAAAPAPLQARGGRRHLERVVERCHAHACHAPACLHLQTLRWASPGTSVWPWELVSACPALPHQLFRQAFVAGGAFLHKSVPGAWRRSHVFSVLLREVCSV